MPRRTRKALLLEEYEALGFTREHVEWMAHHCTADQIQTALDNERALDTIARLAGRSTA